MISEKVYYVKDETNDNVLVLDSGNVYWSELIGTPLELLNAIEIMNNPEKWGITQKNLIVTNRLLSLKDF